MVGNGGEQEAWAGNIDGGDYVFVVSEFGALLVSQRRRYVVWFCIFVGVCLVAGKWRTQLQIRGKFCFNVESGASNFLGF